MGNCRGKMAAGPPVSALDRVASQPSAEDEFPLYRLASYRKTGELLDAYQHGGSKEIERIVREELRLFMYNDGQGRILTTNDFNTWKNSKQRQVALEMEDDAAKDPSSAEKYKFVEHEACWSLECRGSLGETLLHVLIMCNSRIHNRIAKLLVKHYPKVAIDLIEGEEFFGTSALHLALAYGNDELAQMLVQAGANVIQRATGRFFLPTDQQSSTPAKNTNYDGLAYFGEYPLAWAACFENEAMYNYLIDQGADPNMQDSFGNMVLHIVVINDKLSMYGYALRHPMKPAKNDFANKAGLTPLTLACTLGRDNIFREMLELSCVEFWRYSNITCSAYPLNALDTILPDGRTNWKSALMIILRGQSEQHLDMLEGGVIQRLLEDKWKTFARMQFLKRLVILFQHLLVLSIAMYLRPSCSASNNVEGSEGDGETSAPPKSIACNTTLTEDTDVQAIIRYCAEVASCFSSSYYVFIQQGQEILAQGFWTYLKTVMQSPAKFIFVLSNFFILLCIPFRFLKLRDLEDVLLAFAIPGNWFFLMFFAGAIRLTGPFVTMIYSMIAGDMVRFGIIYFIMLLGFSQVFYFLFKIYPPEANDYESYIGTWMSLLHMTLGSYQYSSFGDTHYHVLTRIVFVVFMVLVPILLLNMLIAMMGNTYTQVISKSEKEFVKQWANIVLSLERSISKENAKDFLDAYAINLQSQQGQEQLKGLMVIKSKAKTKARQRKGALSNWKRAGKKVITKLRETGLKGDALRAQILGGQIQVTQGGRDNDSTGTPGVGRSGLDNALSQLAWATGLELNALSNPVPGGDPNQPPVPEEKSSKLDDALQMVTWQHDIELSATSNASKPIDEKTPCVPDIPQDLPQGVENPAFVMDDEVGIGTAPPATTVQTAAPVVLTVPRTEENLRTLAWEENELGKPADTTRQSCRQDLLTGSPPVAQPETQPEASVGKLPEKQETKKKKKKKKRKRHLEEGKEESPDTTNLLPAEPSPRAGRRRRSSRRRRADVPEVVVGVSGLTEVQCEARQTELPSLNTAQPARLIKRWSTTSIASISTLLDNPDNEDTM